VTTEHKNEETIFNTAIQLENPTKLKKYLAEVCGDDIKLRANVEALLKAHNIEGNFLDFPVFDSDITFVDSPLSEGPGTIIGRYKLLERIGEGGMAVVYMAEQKKPIRRKVALKIIKLGMDTKSVIARFEAERQALAMMDHPNIAKVLDAGATETGRPYFAMELVKGTSVTEYCDKNKLNTKDRLGLFIQVCHAVQHAHENGVIHRDIKPSNVMVTLHDSRPIPKVIDFGIAKATNQRLTEKTFFTRYAQMIGTPAYMSPEQAEFSDSEIDMRTDIYSLGILLYEMLTGTTPFAEDELNKAGYLEMQRIICKEVPVKPSTKLSTLGEALTTVAERQKTKPDALKKLIRGDLDWIVMKAIDKDRTRRYETVNDLALDIERHQHYEPISAGPPSIGYCLHKFVLRNRVAVITLSLVAAALAIGATAATIIVWNSGNLPGKVEHAAGMQQRHVWDVPPMSDIMGSITPDGRYLSYVDWSMGGNLAVCDLTSNTHWLVTKNTDPTYQANDGQCEYSAISPDGRQIAYSWYNYKDPKHFDLCLVDSDGANMRVQYSDVTAVYWVRPYAWSPDSREILAYFSDADKSLVDQKTGERYRKGHLVLVSAINGSYRILRTRTRRGFPKNAFFSPDGRYVVYDFEHEDDLTRHDIFLLNLNNSDEISLVEHPANDRLCGWSPDGRRVIFASNRSSRRDLWMIEVINGMPQGQPRKLMGPFDGLPVGLTDNGSFYYSADTAASNVYIARLDSTGLNFEDEPKLASSQFVGFTTMGEWSPDGSLLAYRANTSVWSGPLVIYSTTTSQERIIPTSPPFRPNTRMFGPWWLPDGKSLLVCGKGQENGFGLYEVNVETGSATLILGIDDGRLRQAVWSPDNKSVFLRSPFNLNRLDLASGRESIFYKAGEGPFDLDISPDGRWLAFYYGLSSLVVMPTTGGEPRQVVLLEQNGANAAENYFVRWMPDGKHLLYSHCKSQLWKVNVETGVQQKIGPPIKGLVGVDMHPDGRQIAFTAKQRGSALWVMENFLPD
jgi:serine/threonine protein kinase/Tol biopolymer transport system component